MHGVRHSCTTQPSIICPSERVTFTNMPGKPGSLTTLEANDVYDDFILPVECTVANLSRLPETARGSRKPESSDCLRVRAGFTTPA